MEDLCDVEVQSTPLSLIDGICSTRAIRRYTDDPVPDRVLRDILFAASRAPSGSNRQPFRFVVLRAGPRAVAARQLIATGATAIWTAKAQRDGYQTDSESTPGSPKARISSTMEHYVSALPSVPVLIFACLNRYRPPDPTEGANIYPACQNLLLAARGFGYGGVMTMSHVPVEAAVRELLDIPPGTAIAATITLGKPAGRHGPVRRRPLSEIAFEDSWGAQASWAKDPPGTTFTAAGPPSTTARPGEGSSAIDEGHQPLPHSHEPSRALDTRI